MNKKALITRYAVVMDLSDYEAAATIEKVLQIIAQGLKEDGRVVVSNFGVFEVVVVQRRSYILPTGEKVRKPGHRKVRFRPAPNLEAFVGGKKVPVAVGLPRGKR